MFWFNIIKCYQPGWPVPFKYILCFGSTEDRTRKALGGDLFKYILCFGSTEFDAKSILIKRI